MNLLIIGPQGSGKGTQAVKIAEKYGLLNLSMGELLRGEAKKDTALGKKIKDILAKGNLVPNDITNELLLKNIKSAKKGVILDGYPRNLEQADWLEKNARIDKAILLKLEDAASVKRISGRRMCRKCGFIFHVEFIKPKKKDVCDKCGGELYQRDDDKPAAVKERLNIFHHQTEPVIQFYKKKGILAEINGDQSVENVFEDVVKVLGE